MLYSFSSRFLVNFSLEVLNAERNFLQQLLLLLLADGLEGAEIGRHIPVANIITVAANSSEGLAEGTLAVELFCNEDGHSF